MRCLLLTFDCLPRRWLGCYGSLDNSTRGFDRLAALGTTFENAISQDVRVSPQTLAGFLFSGDAEQSSLKALGGTLPLRASLVMTVEDRPASTGKRKRVRSHLAQKLHQACDWMREQSGQSLAWLRHPGLSLPNPPVVTSDETSSVLEQLATLDDELDAFLDEWLDCADERWTLVVTSGRGVLRPRSSIRRRQEPASSPRMTDDLIRVPLLVLEARGEGFGRRHLPLVSTTCVAEAVRDAATANDHLLMNRLRDFTRDFVRIEADDGAAVRTAEWLWTPTTSADREKGDGELFQKPEDVCDVFDVRSTHADVAIRLDELLAT